MGRFSMRRWSMVLVEEVRSVSTSSASAFTEIVACAPATERDTGSSASWPTVMVTPSAVALAKPWASTVTV
jgi:hypothetical protein